VTAISELCDLVKDQCEPGASGATVYVGLEHFTPGAFTLSGHGTPSDVQSSKNRFRKGDILYGKLRPYLDKAVLAEFDGICSTDILVFRPRPGVCGAYVLSLLHSAPFLNHAISTTHGLNHPRTSWSAIAAFEWNAFPEGQQEKIAAVLWKIQRAIEVEEKLIATTRELKHAAMRQLFTRGLRGQPLKQTDYGELPTSWPTPLLRECCAVQTGATKGRKIAADEAIEVPYLRVANVQDGRLDLREMKRITIRKGELDGYLLRDGDIVVTEGGDFDKLGRGFIWRSEVANCVHQNHIFAVRPDRAMLSPEYLAYLVQSPYGRSYFLAVAHKTTNLACINATKLKAFPVPVPPMDEQLEIAAILQSVDRTLTVHERKRSTLQELFKTMLHQLMTGQIRVDKLDIDVSEVRT
jgi:type I restriction enzyme, S subunit